MNCCNTDPIIVRKGETLRRHFVLIPASASDVLVVQSASWVLINKATNQESAHGNCTWDTENFDKKLWCVVPFSETGMYELKCTVVIPPETIIQSAHIKVVH